MPAEKRPLRYVLSATPRMRPNQTVWGLVLECGHYVERDSRPPEPVVKEPRARCDDCLRGARSVAAALSDCKTCTPMMTKEGRRYGQPGCAACHGFGRLEKLYGNTDLLNGPAPGTVSGDHILGLWMMNLAGDMMVTLIAKRGRHYIGEHTRAFVGEPSHTINMEAVAKDPASSMQKIDGGVTVIKNRFFPTSNISAECLLKDSDRSFRAAFESSAPQIAYYKRAFYEANTSDRTRVGEMQTVFENILNEQVNG